jgi:hypothetical protein
MNNSNFSGSGVGNTSNRRLSLLVSGNLVINSNIVSALTYAPDAMPTTVFIVSGNIYVDHSVTRIDGLLIARGTIYTCSSAGAPITARAASGSTANCDAPLLVNGQMIANNIDFGRTYGGTNEAATGTSINTRCRPLDTYLFTNNSRRCTAEAVNFVPGIYLNGIKLDYGSVLPNQYEIQQIRDLPPVF